MIFFLSVVGSETCIIRDLLRANLTFGQTRLANLIYKGLVGLCLTIVFFLFCGYFCCCGLYIYFYFFYSLFCYKIKVICFAFAIKAKCFAEWFNLGKILLSMHYSELHSVYQPGNWKTWNSQGISGVTPGILWAIKFVNQFFFVKSCNFKFVYTLNFCLSLDITQIIKFFENNTNNSLGQSLSKL